MPKTISVTISDEDWLTLNDIQHQELKKNQKKISLSNLIAEMVQENLKNKKSQS